MNEEYTNNVLEMIRREAKLLGSHAPELKGPRALEFYEVLVKGGREYGFSEAEVNNICDHRLMLLFRDAFTHLGMWRQD